MPVRTRPSSRILVIDQDHRILLFRFVYANGVLGGREWWATPGGAVENNETYTEAARRELFEETGFVSDIFEPHIAEREFMLQMPSGEQVLAKERFFVVRVTSQAISTLNWTDEEQRVMKDYKWWSVDELMTTKEVVFPVDLLAILGSVCMQW